MPHWTRTGTGLMVVPVKSYLRYYVAVVLLVTGLLGFKMLFSSDTAEADSGATKCEQVIAGAKKLEGQANQAKAANDTVGQLQNLFAVFHMVVNDAQCFPPEDVAAAQAAIDGRRR